MPARQNIIVIVISCFGLFSAVRAAESSKQENLNLNDFKYLVAPPNQNSWDKMAEQELQYYFHKITGKKLETIEAINTSGGNIFLGAPALATGLLEEEAIADVKDDGDGFSVTADGKNVAIYSKNSIGSIYGAYAFFEKLGLKIYANDCEVLPPADIPVPNFNLTSNPAFSRFAMAFNFYYYSVFNIEDLTRLGYSPTLGGIRMEPGKPSLSVAPGWVDPVYAKYYGLSDGCIHCMAFLVPPYLYLEKHPEFYARDKNGKVLVDLKKTSAYTVHLCLSNPEVFKIVLERYLDWMAKTPSAKYYDFTSGDSWNFCQCPECKKLDPQDVATFPGEFSAVSHMSDRILWFANKLARETKKHYPAKIILVSAYQATVEPPRLIKAVESNVGIQLCAESCGGVKSQAHDQFSPLNERFLNNFLKWKQFAPEQIYMFEYPMNYYDIYAPFFSHDAVRNKARFYHAQGVKGIEYCGQPFLFTKMFVYVQGKLRWDPGQPTDKLEEDFLKAYYGPAAGAMQDFIELIRAKIYDKKPSVHQSEWSTINTLITRDFVDKAYEIFAKAEKAVKDNRLFYDRVRYEKLCGVLWGDLDQHITKNETQRFFRLKELADICRSAQDKRSIGRLTPSRSGDLEHEGLSMEEWLKNKFYITLPKDTPAAWYATPLIQKLSACANDKEIEEFINGLAKEQKARQQEIGNTLELLLEGFTVCGGSVNDRPRLSDDGEYGLLLYGGDSAATTFLLESKAPQDTTLSILGIDHDKPGRAKFTLGINGHVVFNGENSFSKKGWTEMTIAIPGKYLKAGENELEIKNLEERVVFANWIFFRKPGLSIPSQWKVLKQWEYSGSRPTNAPSMPNEPEYIMYNEPGYKANIYMDKKVFSPIGNPIRVEIEEHPYVERDGVGNQIQFVFTYKDKILKKGDQLRISFWVKTTTPTVSVKAFLTQLGPPYSLLGQNAQSAFIVDGTWRQIMLETETTNSCEAIATPRIFLGNVDQGSVLYFSPIVAEYQESHKAVGAVP